MRLAFIIEAVDPVDTSTFVVTSQDEEVFGVFDLAVGVVRSGSTRPKY